MEMLLEESKAGSNSIRKGEGNLNVQKQLFLVNNVIDYGHEIPKSSSQYSIVSLQSRFSPRVQRRWQ